MYLGNYSEYVGPFLNSPYRTIARLALANVEPGFVSKRGQGRPADKGCEKREQQPDLAACVVLQY